MKNFSIEENHIKNLSIKRDELLYEYEHWDGGKKDDKKYKLYPDKILSLNNEIFENIKRWKYSLSFEFIFEELNKFGMEPSLLCEDEEFAMINERNYIDEVPRDFWKPSVREALDYYLETV